MEKENTPFTPNFWKWYYIVLFTVLGVFFLFYGQKIALKLTGNRNGLIGKWLEGDKPALVDHAPTKTSVTLP